MDCAIPQDITHMEANIQDDSLLNQDNVCLPIIDHKDTIALRNLLENECSCAKKWTNNVIFWASLDLKSYKDIYIRQLVGESK